MLQPTWLVDTLAGVMVATSTYCLIRLVVARVWRRESHRDTSVAHTADGVAMAGMLVASLRVLPDGAWEVVFAGLTVWFAVRGARFVVRHGIGSAGGDHAYNLSHYLSHLVMAGAMLYMFVEASPAASGSTTTAGAMSAMGGATGRSSNLGGLTLVLVLVLFASAVWHADSLTRFTTTRRALVGAGAPVPSDNALLSAAGGAGTDGHAPPDADPAVPSRWLTPRLETACHIVLCITMGYMLVLML